MSAQPVSINTSHFNTETKNHHSVTHRATQHHCRQAACQLERDDSLQVRADSEKQCRETSHHRSALGWSLWTWQNLKLQLFCISPP